MSMQVWKRAACAALLLSAAPAFAQATPDYSQAPFGRVAAVVDVEPSVAAFYQRRNNEPMWLKPGNVAAASVLIGMLKQAELDGLASGPALARQAEAAMVRARSGNPADVLAAEHALSTGWVRYVNALRAPAAGMTYADSSLTPARPRSDLLLQQASGTRSLTDHIANIAAVNPVYAELRQAAWNHAQANGGIDARVLANLQRARTLPAKGRHVLVDAGAARLYMIDGGRIVDSMKVVVGKPSSQTPMLASRIHYATLNPYWNIPTDLTQKLIAPRVLEQGVGYLKAKGYQVLSGYEDDAQVLDPGTVDWKAVANGTVTARVRQLPGGSNAMGDIKLFFVNSGGIYLHDTPEKQLFAKEQRNFSNGCVRLEDAGRLTRWLMGRDPRGEASAPEQHIKLAEGVPIYITYLTAQANNGQLAFIDDVYGRDQNGTRMAGGFEMSTAR